MMLPVIHAWIFVRSGSIRFAERNLQKLNDKPLIEYTIETAKKSRYIKEVFVSTDSPEIAAAAEQCGAIVPFLRPDELSSDMVPVQSAWKHAAEWNRQQTEFPKMDIMVSLPMTVPMRTADEITRAIDLYLEGNCDSVIAVTKSNRHPAYDMVYLQGDDASLVLPNVDPFARKRISEVYDITNLIHVCSAESAIKNENYLRKRTKAIEVPLEHSFDIRTKWDFKLAEMMLKENEK